MTQLRVARFSELSTHELYALLKLRVDVFVVEQRCSYLELDGRDDEPGTVHLWVAEEDGGVPLTYVRVLDDGEEWRIGRVVTASAARGRGLAEQLMRRALELTKGRPVVLDAQAHLERWYERFGFVRAGADFDEDGIPHVPLRLERRS